MKFSPEKMTVNRIVIFDLFIEKESPNDMIVLIYKK